MFVPIEFVNFSCNIPTVPCLIFSPLTFVIGITPPAVEVANNSSDDFNISIVIDFLLTLIFSSFAKIKNRLSCDAF